MELITTMDEKNIWFENYQESVDISFPFEHKPFVGIVWNNKENFVSKPLIESLLKENCKYFLVGGYNCQEWENQADMTRYYLNPDNNEEEFVMTTSHQDEPLNEVIWFALNNTNFDYHDFKNFLIVQIGQKYSKEEILDFINKSVFVE